MIDCKKITYSLEFKDDPITFLVFASFTTFLHSKRPGAYKNLYFQTSSINRLVFMQNVARAKVSTDNLQLAHPMHPQQ